MQEESNAANSTAAPFQTLRNLDTIKTNLERCVKVLQETGNWNSLVREMESYFASRNLGEVASRITTMRNSMDTLVNVPGASERADMMERMEQRLESLLRPGLQTALEQAARGEYEALRESVQVFYKLGRKDALLTDLGESRGKICFQACWEDPANDGAEKLHFSRFLDKVLVHLRETCVPLCKLAFNEQTEDVETALAWIIKACFHHVSSDLIVGLIQAPQNLIDVDSCERYVAAREAAGLLVQDVASSLLSTLNEDAMKGVSNSIMKSFLDLDEDFLKWETDAIYQSYLALLTSNSIESSADDILAPSAFEVSLSKMRADDILENVCEKSISRCERIGKHALVPVSHLFTSHSQTCGKILRDETKTISNGANNESRLLMVIVSLKQRYSGICDRMNTCDDISTKTNCLEGLDDLIGEAKSKLFTAFTQPSLELIEQVVKTTVDEKSVVSGPSDAITKAIDHLYSLIPLLEFDPPAVDLAANSVQLGSAERDALSRSVNGDIKYRESDDSQQHWDEDPEELVRQVSASWLEAVARAMSTGFVLRLLQVKKLNDKTSAQLGEDADCLEKNVGSVLGQTDLWDPALGTCRIILSAGPGLTQLKLGDPTQYLDERYCTEPESVEALKALEHQLVALRNRS